MKGDRMPENVEQPISQDGLKLKIYGVLSQLAPEHGINLKENEFLKYVTQLLADEFRGRDDATLGEITAALELPLFIASISKTGMDRCEIWYATAYCREKMIEKEYDEFKHGYKGAHSSKEEIALYLRFFQKKGLMEDYDGWLEKTWRMEYSESGETSDFWMSGMFMMRHFIRKKMEQLEMPIAEQNKKSHKPAKVKN
jgi:hypothetical protein